MLTMGYPSGFASLSELTDFDTADTYKENPYLTKLPKRSDSLKWVDAFDESDSTADNDDDNKKPCSVEPMSCAIKSSVELQDAVNSLNMPELNNLKFSVSVADPNEAEFPLVACSTGFSELTGYSLQEIVGRNCRFLLNGVPASEINEDARIRVRDFCAAAKAGETYNSSVGAPPEGVSPCTFDLNPGEVLCVQTNATKQGDLFRNLFWMKQVWLDDRQYIIALQAALPEELEEGSELEGLEKQCHHVSERLREHMSTIQAVLCSQFWYSAPMGREM